MTERKRIPLDIQKQVLLRSRRRCCLCFWLSGIDDVVKGQMAHLDGDPSNHELDNLAFLCFNHHDEFDGRTSTSKGLQLEEVRQWRNELYKEMEYRFRTVKSRRLALMIDRFLYVDGTDRFKLRFRLKNAGESEVRNVTVSIRLPQHVSGRVPKSPPRRIPTSFGHSIAVPDFDMSGLLGMQEIREDFFEPGGRVGSIDPLPRLCPVLLPDHSVKFEGLSFGQAEYPDDSTIKLEYRLDAEQMEPIVGRIEATVPKGMEWLLARKEELGLPDDITVDELEKLYSGNGD